MKRNLRTERIRGSRGLMLGVIGCLTALILASFPAVLGDEMMSFGQPGFPTSAMDEQGRLVEDWGTLRVVVRGKGIPEEAKTTVQKVTLEGVIPAVAAKSEYGPITLTQTAYRAPAWPAGLDVLSVKVQETSGREAKISLALELPEKAQVGEDSVTVGGKVVVMLPPTPRPVRNEREWGHTGDAVALPGWAKPQGTCDPAFRNIRAGMGGVPIVYRFAVPKKGSAQVVLGFCESHWGEAGQRPLVCKVEGAAPQEVDPIAKWGRHKPGALLFLAQDENEDGRLDVCVRPQPGAKDRNPILNVIWIFQPDLKLNLEHVIAGQLNAAALRYVDVGGKADQSLYDSNVLEYQVALPPSGAQEMSFIVACPGASAPNPGRTAWTPEKLLQAAKEIWREACK